MVALDLSTAEVLREHQALLSWVGHLQRECSASIARQAQQIETLESELMRLRAALIVQTTLRAQERAEHEAWVQAHADLPRRIRLARCIDGLFARLQTLLRERLSVQWRTEANTASGSGGRSMQARSIEAPADAEGLDEELLARSVAEADLVICQTGCLSHDAYWRVQGHCRRLGKPCLLVHDEAHVIQFVPPHEASPLQRAAPGDHQDATLLIMSVTSPP